MPEATNMIVDQELIKRYHQNRCTPQEAAAVEDWLFSESPAEQLDLPEDENKLDHKAAMWTALSATMYASQVHVKEPQKKRIQWPALSLSIAASLLFVVVGAYFFYSNSALPPADHSLQASAGIEANGLHILLGDKSKASINTSSTKSLGSVDFCGMILINPKQDMELTLHAQCLSQSTDDSKIKNLKKGQRYIAFNYKFNSTNEVILVHENNLNSLPPVLQREIMKQFNI